MPLNVETIRGARPQNQVHYFRSIGSTMQEAGRLASAGAPHGTIVIADEQTSGIGRLGRSWVSPPEAGIYCSILLRLSLAANSLPVAALMLGLAVKDAVEKTAGLACDLRWPNDILIKERKVAGILAQVADACIVAGIGINVHQREFPDDLRTPATSLWIESNGAMQSREKLIVALLAALDGYSSMLEAEGPSPVLRAFTAASTYATNRRVIVEDTGFRGTTAGLDPDGFLLIRSDSGSLRRVASGGVRADR